MVKTDQQQRAAMSWFIIEFEDRLKNHLVKMVITQNYLQGLHEYKLCNAFACFVNCSRKLCGSNTSTNA